MMEKTHSSHQNKEWADLIETRMATHVKSQKFVINTKA